MKKFVALLLVVVMAMSLVACSGNTSSSTASSTSSGDNGTTAEEIQEAAKESTGAVSVQDMMDTSIVDTTRKSTLNSDERYPEVTVATQTEITTWTPWQTAQGRSALILTVYEPLFYYHDGYELEPCLAKAWNEVDDTHFEVEIYDYIYDSDGNNLTADDVVAAYNYFVASGNANDFSFFGSVEATGDYTVLFTWNSRITTLTSLATMMEVGMYTQAAFNAHDFTTDPVGTGSYKLTELVTGSKYVLEPTDYWQTDENSRASVSLQNVDKLTMEVISESNVRYVSFEEGSLFSVTPNATQLADFLEGGKHYGEYSLVYEKQTSDYGVGFNMSGESILSDDINLRLAIAYAIDSEGIVIALGENSYYQEHAEGGSTISGYQSEWDTMENYYSVYDVDLAKEYLEKSGYNGEELVILNQSGDDSKETASQIIQQQLSVIGINSRIDTYEHAIINTYLYDVTYWDLFIYQWAGDPISQLWGRQSDITNYSHGYTETGINDPTLQDMIARVQTVDGYSDELIKEIQAYFTDNCLLYAIYGSISWTAYDTSIASLATAHGHKDVYYNACNYYLD
jgi:ABC-type transport system substrate-binding protein